MNMKRGFFRIWIVISLLWMIGISTTVVYTDIKNYPANFEIAIPIFKDYPKIQFPYSGINIDHIYSTMTSLWIKNENEGKVLPRKQIKHNFPNLYSYVFDEWYSDNKQEFAQKMVTEVKNKLLTRRNQNIGNALIVLAPPVLLFLLGAVTIWITSGFKNR